ncbi:unnamed protein product, partial [marine sediment metagenome]
MNSISQEEKYYLKIGRASDLKKRSEQILFRLFEIFPGVLSWGVLLLAIFLSWKSPLWVSVFIIVFVVFWFFRTIYFSLYLWMGYRKMSEHEETDWIEKLHKLPANKWKEIYHLIVIPMFKESTDVVRNSLESLEKTDYPKDKMIIVLACEEKVRDFVETTAKEIKKEFSSKFFKFIITWHPADLPGEISGKGSNETWATREVKEKVIDPLKIPYRNIIFSSFDVDTCVFPKYFR